MGRLGRHTEAMCPLGIPSEVCESRAQAHSWVWRHKLGSYTQQDGRKVKPKGWIRSFTKSREAEKGLRTETAGT